MKNLKALLEKVFYQDNLTVTLSFEGNPQAMENIIATFDKIKPILHNIGIDIMSFFPEAGCLTIITTKDKVDEIQKIASDFGATFI